MFHRNERIKMEILLRYLIVFYNQDLITVRALNRTCIQQIAERIATVSPPQVTFIFNNRHSEVDVLSSLISKVNISSTLSNVSLLSHFYLDNQSSINVLPIEKENDYGDYKNYIDVYEKLYPNKPRPRTLVILIGKYYDSDGFIESMLEYGWSKKFLDVSLVEDRNHRCVVREYNPFIGTHSNASLDVSDQMVVPLEESKVDRVKLSNLDLIFRHHFHFTLRASRLTARGASEKSHFRK
ncbi:unnamed protein product [Trichogramma brassicae]|uniref:Uncharacterized protein n=1 Tax=Trichogramma brassicae TaxID=86971 RepID=A0A6H5HX67_9HYME|nr:unnamed protein product [Trichogramma brassicae]